MLRKQIGKVIVCILIVTVCLEQLEHYEIVDYIITGFINSIAFLVFWFPFVVCVTDFVKDKEYRQSEYFMQTHIPYLDMRLNKGTFGEYCIYKQLKLLCGYKKYLFNCYLPSSDSMTTEVDIILLHGTGIYVFESKNYSGWIFGTETQQQWTQTLPIGNRRTQKVHFLNPIIQNEVHLKWLKEYIGRTQPCYSYIVFSNRCTLKNITLTSGKHHVLNCKDLLKTIQQDAAITGNRLSKEEVDFLYDKLYPLTQVNEGQKRVHMENIRRKYSTKV